jgi:hypothetical protein
LEIYPVKNKNTSKQSFEARMIILLQGFPIRGSRAKRVIPEWDMPGLCPGFLFFRVGIECVFQKITRGYFKCSSLSSSFIWLMSLFKSLFKQIELFQSQS